MYSPIGNTEGAVGASTLFHRMIYHEAHELPCQLMPNTQTTDPCSFDPKIKPHEPSSDMILKMADCTHRV